MIFGTCQKYFLEWLSFLVDNEKISNARHKELHFVKTRLQDAIRKKLKDDFRLDVGLFSLSEYEKKYLIYHVLLFQPQFICENVYNFFKAFGSSENGFGSNKSDYDVCFRYGNDNYERVH